ncbi:MAG: LysR family transcriptional regulator [Actinobacteria bacterium]|nr:LysR family transcriptional regulator [Actinomycetota bacterium]
MGVVSPRYVSIFAHPCPIIQGERRDRGHLNPRYRVPMEVRHLASLIAIADHGSFSAAARALGTVQSNVSAHIARLEKGTRRDAGRPTDRQAHRRGRGRRRTRSTDHPRTAGHRSGHPLRRRRDRGRDAPRLHRHHGTLADAATARRSRQAAPGIHATIHEGSTSTLVPRLIDGQLDAAIVHFPVDAPELQLEPLFSEELILLVHTDHEWSKLTTISLTELATQPILLAPRSTALRRIIDRAAGNQRVALTALAEIDGVRLLASLAFDGFGPAIVPATAVPDWLTGQFVRVAIPELPKRAVGWATRRRPLPNKPTRATFDVLRATIARVGDRQPGITTNMSPLTK